MTEIKGHKEKKRHYYQELEERFDEVWNSAISTFRINKTINMIVVGIGITLIVYGLVFQWYDSFVYNHPTASPKSITDDQANVTSANSNSETQPNIPNLTGLISSGTGLATIVGLFFFKSQAHIQRAFTNLALTNFISTANMWGFKRLDWYMWAKYKVPTLKEDDPERLKAGNFSYVKDIPFEKYAELLDKMQVLTKEYSAQLYKKTRLMDDLIEQEKKGKKKDDTISSDNGEDANKTDTTSTDKEKQ